MNAPRVDPNEMTLERKIALLKDPFTYPKSPGRVSTIETHMSCVFLTDAHAYKLKKPVRLAFLDFSTLAAREWNCREELRLNQRLAPHTYLGVVPLAVTPSGDVKLEADGTVLEWLVKMRRLPAERMLDALIRNRSVTPGEIRNVAARLAEFYLESRALVSNGTEYRALCDGRIASNHRLLSSPAYALERNAVDHIHDQLRQILRRHRELFDQRAEQGHVIEGHGDLRPEHVCLEERPLIIDRLEFNRDLRVLDAMEELCFLDMECTRMGAPFIGEIVFEVYAHITKDQAPSILRTFYTAHRACIRAGLAAMHVDDHDPSVRSRWLGKAVEYLEIARTQLSQPSP